MNSPLDEPLAIIAPLASESIAVPTSARTAWQRCQRLGSAVEQFFDPYDVQSFTFEADWRELPGINRLFAKAQKEFEVLNATEPAWTIADSSFGIYYPFYASLFEHLNINPKFELPVWPIQGEEIGRYVHRLLTAINSNIPNLTYSERAGKPPFFENSPLLIVRTTLDLAGQSLVGTAEKHLSQQTLNEWNRMGVVRNAFHKPGAVTLKGQGLGGSPTEQSVPIRVARTWQQVKFELTTHPGKDARLVFSPPMRSVSIRSVMAVEHDQIIPIEVRAGGPSHLETLDNHVQVFSPYTEQSFLQLSVPTASSISQITMEVQVRDDPVAELAMLDAATKRHR